MALVPDKKTVLITGCSPGGIGYSLAKEYHSKGLHVIATARDRAVLTSLEELGMTTLSLDVTSQSNIEKVKEEVSKLTGGGLDILVNNAGMNYTLPALDVNIEGAKKVFDTNFFAVVAMTQVFAPLLIANKGLIVNIGSVAAIVPYVFGSIYNASKAALHSYSSTLRLELAPFDVKVMLIVTGGVQSRIARTDRELPDHSYYLEIDDAFQKRVKHSQDGAMSNESYAQGLVRESLKTKPKQEVWRGNRTFVIWLCFGWLSKYPVIRFLTRTFGLERLASIVRRKGVEGLRGQKKGI